MKPSTFLGILVPFILIMFYSRDSMAQHTGRMRFDEGWKFHLGEVTGAELERFTDASWKTVNLPHDWSIEEPFSKTSRNGVSGGALPGGVGWYRKTFVLTQSNSQYIIEFDGVYRNSEVWINGHFLGKRPYGYSSFVYDLSPYLNKGKSQNVIAVRADNSALPNSRWYSGSGIFRHVWLIRTAGIHIVPWGTFVSSTLQGSDSAVITTQVWVANKEKEDQSVELNSEILNSQGETVGRARETITIHASDSMLVKHRFYLAGAQRWSLTSPVLYELKNELILDTKAIDGYTTQFGIRSIRFDKDQGFFLNGKNIKIKGVCEHHDLGCLGSAFNDRAMERKLEILKAAGVNALRTSHNPPAPEVLDLCDKMGILVMDEAFDMWEEAKTEFDYSLNFDAWHERDLGDMVRRDRNHPAIILWSIGNEIPEQHLPQGGRIAAELSLIVKKLDTTRFVSSACDNVSAASKNGYADALDAVGINYHIGLYDRQHQEFPNRLLFGSETTSALATRNVFHMPADTLLLKSKDLTCSSYDNCYVDWGSSAEAGVSAILDRPFMAGMFVWTGFDYIGEPTPYDWPAHTSYFGFIDLCGFPKAPYYMYQSAWTDRPVVHLLPHWNWKKGQPVDVWAYTNCEEVRLYLNDKLVEAKKPLRGRFHAAWKIPFESGVLRAEGYKNGLRVVGDTIKTAGAPVHMLLSSDRSRLKADGRDLAFITVKVVDASGTLVPDASQNIEFRAEGQGTVAGLDNGNQTSLEPFHSTSRKAFNGLALAVLRTKKTKGKIILYARSRGLSDASITLESH